MIQDCDEKWFLFQNQTKQELKKTLTRDVKVEKVKLKTNCSCCSQYQNNPPWRHIFTYKHTNHTTIDEEITVIWKLPHPAKANDQLRMCEKKNKATNIPCKVKAADGEVNEQLVNGCFLPRALFYSHFQLIWEIRRIDELIVGLRDGLLQTTWIRFHDTWFHFNWIYYWPHRVICVLESVRFSSTSLWVCVLNFRTNRWLIRVKIHTNGSFNTKSLSRPVSDTCFSSTWVVY